MCVCVCVCVCVRVCVCLSPAFMLAHPVDRSRHIGDFFFAFSVSSFAQIGRLIHSKNVAFDRILFHLNSVTKRHNLNYFTSHRVLECLYRVTGLFVYNNTILQNISCRHKCGNRGLIVTTYK